MWSQMVIQFHARTYAPIARTFTGMASSVIATHLCVGLAWFPGKLAVAGYAIQEPKLAGRLQNQ